MKIKIVPSKVEIGLKSARDIHKIGLINQYFSFQEENSLTEPGI
jgi:hypothetical protein